MRRTALSTFLCLTALASTGAAQPFVFDSNVTPPEWDAFGAFWPGEDVPDGACPGTETDPRACFGPARWHSAVAREARWCEIYGGLGAHPCDVVIDQAWGDDVHEFIPPFPPALPFFALQADISVDQLVQRRGRAAWLAYSASVDRLTGALWSEESFPPWHSYNVTATTIESLRRIYDPFLPFVFDVRIPVRLVQHGAEVLDLWKTLRALGAPVDCQTPCPIVVPLIQEGVESLAYCSVERVGSTFGAPQGCVMVVEFRQPETLLRASINDARGGAEGREDFVCRLPSTTLSDAVASIARMLRARHDQQPPDVRAFPGGTSTRITSTHYGRSRVLDKFERSTLIVVVSGSSPPLSVSVSTSILVSTRNASDSEDFRGLNKTEQSRYIEKIKSWLEAVGCGNFDAGPS